VASGGGSINGGGTNVQTCTAAGGGVQLASAATGFTVTSNPSGLVVTLNNGAATTNVGSTPVTVTAAVSNSLQTVTVDPTGSCFQVQFTNNGSGGSQALFFNKLAYTAGQVNVASIQSALRSTSSLDTSNLVARGPARFAGLPGVDQSQVYVHYSASALRAAGRSAQSVASSVGARSTTQIAVSGDDMLHAVPVPAGQSLDAFSSAIRSQAGVTKVEPVHLRYHAVTTAVSPNDCHFGAEVVDTTCTGLIGKQQQWDMTQIRGPNAWAYFGGTPFAAKTSKIAIVDTGYDCNATVDNLTTNVVFAESIIGGTPGAPGTSSGCSALDTDGHGTNVAGIADAVTNNANGFAGVGANARLFIYRIFPAGVNQSASTADEAAAINDAVNTQHVNVINLSLGGPAATSFDAGEQAAIQNAINAGVSVVAAAGNDGNASIDYPAAYTGVISVGATSLADGQINGRGNTNGSAASPVEYIASYSNWGPNLTIVAPGGDPNTGSDNDNLHWITNLYSTGDTTAGNTCTPSGQPDNVCAAKFAGTSQATPHVTGAVALIAAKNSGLSPAQVLQVLQSTADDICSVASFACPSGPIMEGKGRLDIYRALAAVTNDSNPPAYKPVTNQFIAFAYSGTFAFGGTPPIINQTFTKGVPIGSTGAFQMGDVPASTGAYKIGVWYNAAGNGILSAGDSFGFANCSGQTTCSAASNITISRVTTGQSF
jgi:subtilisin family serine protease